MRLFIGLNIPKKERERIHRAVRPLRDEGLPVRWVDPDQYHITLKFLGEVRPDRLETIGAAMERVAKETPVFGTSFSGFGAFPTIRRPQVIWLGLEANPALRCLKQDIEWTLGDCGFEAETRAFHLHVTLGRADDRGGAGVFRGLDRIVQDMDFRADYKVRSLDLMRSRLTSSGARYSVESGAKLAKERLKR